MLTHHVRFFFLLLNFTKDLKQAIHMFELVLGMTMTQNFLLLLKNIILKKQHLYLHLIFLSH